MSMVLELLGLKLSEKQQDIKNLVEKSYKTVRVVGRGTVKIDESEVVKSKGFREAREKAELLFKNIQ